MKKIFLTLVALFSLSIPLAAEKSIDFFADEIPRYEGFALGASFINQWALGEYSDYASCNFGGEVDAEYTLPLVLPNNLDLGISARADFLIVSPKSGSTLKSEKEMRFSGGLWLRVPFALKGAWFAFQPELSLGASLFSTEGQNGAKASGTYLGSVIGLATGFRFIPKAIPDLEIEAAPLFTVTPEASSHITTQVGVRLGFVYHIQNFITKKLKESKEKKEAALAEQKRLEIERQESEAKRLREEEEARRKAIAEAADEEARRAAEEELRKAEEARKAAEEEAARIAEEERKRAEEEAARVAAEEARKAEIAAWPAPEAVLAVIGGTNFTPDGDGQHDTVTFQPGIKYVEEAPESWILAIDDPQGNPFRTFKGKGALPESIEWDGLSDRGEAVYSRNVYKSKLTVIPSRHDRTRSGAKNAETSTEVHTGLLLQVIVPEHEWKIVVNTIYFAGGGASFDGLNSEQLKANAETLDEVAEQITAHPGSNVVVEGYANNISGTAKEDTEELIPLSQERADFIVKELAARGINQESLSATGKGGANPIASRKDRANWWKNRRIEFIIRK